MKSLLAYVVFCVVVVVAWSRLSPVPVTPAVHPAPVVHHAPSCQTLEATGASVSNKTDIRQAVFCAMSGYEVTVKP